MFEHVLIITCISFNTYASNTMSPTYNRQCHRYQNSTTDIYKIIPFFDSERPSVNVFTPSFWLTTVLPVFPNFELWWRLSNWGDDGSYIHIDDSSKQNGLQFRVLLLSACILGHLFQLSRRCLLTYLLITLNMLRCQFNCVWPINIPIASLSVCR